MNCPTDAKGEVVWLSNARQGGLPVFLGLKPGCLVFTSSLVHEPTKAVFYKPAAKPPTTTLAPAARQSSEP